MTVGPTDDNDWEEAAEVIGEQVEKFRTVLTEVTTDDSIDPEDKLPEMCRRLDIPLSDPEFDAFGVCPLCVAWIGPSRRGDHVTWHRRLQASVKWGQHAGMLAFQQTNLLGMIVRDLVAVAVDEDTGEEGT